ncbi:MAG TPA: sensor domain-containing diguanylate cyclase [Thermoleophilaceae bacterium]|nr:sensor domain-containing diguanylate cyclase [Thermoleophilaceae bacterium]
MELGVKGHEQILGLLPVGVTVWEATSDDPGDLLLHYANDAASAESRREMRLCEGKTMREAFAPALEGDAFWPRTYQRACVEQQHAVIEAPFSLDGPQGTFRVRITPVGHRCSVVICENVTEARSQDLLHRRVIENLLEGVVVLDDEGRILDANPAAERLARVSLVDALGRRLEELDIDVFDEAGRRLTPETAPSSRARRGEAMEGVPLRFVYADGDELWVSVSATSLAEEGKGYGAVTTLVDMTERHSREQRFRFEAEHDHLTGLANRRTFDRALHRAVENRRRAQDSENGLAVVIFDLDDFKPLNDRFGHGHGDRVLVTAAARLQAACRGGDLVARIGGDEFVALLTGLRDPVEAAEAFCIRARETLADASISASAGTACFPNDGDTPEELLAAADRAMYAVKATR